MDGIATRIVFAGGGTGGHLFPALAVADELRRRTTSRDIEFIGGRRGLEVRLVPRAGYPLRTLAMAGIQGRGVVERVGAGCLAAVAVVRCLGWMVRRRPALVVGVGGYASGPAVLAASWLGVPVMLMEQNHFPGATNRLLARRAAAVCVPSDAARERLGGIGIVTGNPVRPEFFEARPEDTPADGRPRLLIFGGSRGAHSINMGMERVAPVLAAMDPRPRIVHQTGEADVERVRGFWRDHDDAEVLPFLDDMPRRLAEADLVVCRAGAMTLAELAAAGRPAILVPYPHAADDHQRHNAQAVVDAGAARMVLDERLGGDALADEVRTLLADDARRRRMAAASRTLAAPDATRRIADVAESLLAGGKGGADVP